MTTMTTRAHDVLTHRPRGASRRTATAPSASMPNSGLQRWTGLRRWFAQIQWNRVADVREQAGRGLHHEADERRLLGTIR